MKKAIEGSKIIYLFRIKDEQAEQNAKVIAYTTQNSRSLSGGVGTAQTKDGPVATPGTVEETVSVTSYYAKDDDMPDKIEEAIKNNKTMEIWEADLEQPLPENGDDKYKGQYWEGKISSWSKSTPADGLTELSTEFVLEGGGKKGPVTISASMKEEFYDFLDTLAIGSGGGNDDSGNNDGGNNDDENGVGA